MNIQKLSIYLIAFIMMVFSFGIQGQSSQMVEQDYTTTLENAYDDDDEEDEVDTEEEIREVTREDREEDDHSKDLVAEESTYEEDLDRDDQNEVDDYEDY